MFSPTSQEPVVFQVGCEHGVEGLYVIPQGESPTGRLLRITPEEADRVGCNPDRGSVILL